MRLLEEEEERWELMIAAAGGAEVLDNQSKGCSC